jgi:hypothetical protein
MEAISNPAIRNFDNLMSERNTFAAPIPRFAQAGATCTHESASISAPHESPSSATTPCSSRRKPWPSWTFPSTTG